MADVLPIRIGRFELLSLLGHGGFGIVFRALDSKLGRHVALKILRPDVALSGRVQRRFLREAAAAAQLEHPGIISVYDAGQQAGLSYLAAPLCDGPNLAHWISDHPHELTPRQCAALVAQVADAVQHAHARGILHRDLKPSNILLKASHIEDSPLPFEPLLTDFGLARRLEQGGDETSQGMILGTTAYMSPEQALGQWKEVGVASDVFSLGIVLYELLVGSRPFHGSSPEEVRQNIVSAHPNAPRRVNRSVPADLETICLKCLEKSSHDRYLTAGELATDLRRFVDHQPILAHPPGMAKQIWFFCRRRPMVAGLTFLLAITLLISSVITGMLYSRERQLRQHADEVNQQLQRTLYANRVALAERYLAMNLPTVAAANLDQCSAKLRGWEWHCLKRASLPNPHRMFNPRLKFVRGIAASPKGGTILVAGTDGALLLMQCATGATIPLIGHKGNVTGVAFSADGRWAASGGVDRLVRLWECSTGSLVRGFEGHTDDVLAIAFAPDGERLASAGHDGTLRLWQINGETPPTVFSANQQSVYSLSFNPDGRWLASGGKDQAVRIWEIATGQAIATLNSKNGGITAICFSPNGKMLASAGHDKLVRLWDCNRWEQTQSLEGHADTVWRLAFIDDAKLLSAGGDGTVRVHDLNTRAELNMLTGHEGSVNALAVELKSGETISGGKDGTIRVWPPGAHRTPHVLTGHNSGVSIVECSADGRLLATASGDEAVRLWEVDLGTCFNSVDSQHGRVLDIAFHPNGKTIALTGDDWTVSFHDIATGSEICSPIQLSGRPRCCTYSPDGNYLLVAASVGNDAELSELRAWPVVANAESTKIVGPVPMIRGMSFNGNGDALALAAGDQLSIVEWPSAAERFAVRPAGDAIGPVQFTPDGLHVATGDSQGRVCVWDSYSGRHVRSFSANSSNITALVFHPSQPRLFSAGYDRTIKVWNWATGEEIVALTRHDHIIRSLAISPDGHKLFSASDDGTARIWDGTP